MPIQVLQQSGGTAMISDEAVADLRTTFHGPLLAHGDPGYEDARVVHNGMIDRRPGLIVQCTGVADVVDTVNLAADRDLVVAVRGGGHSVAGHSTCDGGLVVDLSAMRAVWVDAAVNAVRVQGGATWGDVDRETARLGLVVPGGVVSTTGVGGLTLGGGIGWLHRKYGLACDNLRAVELVTAAGSVIRASESENPDLFWGLRGGGGNFGIATAFEFDALPLPAVVSGALPVYAARDAREVLRAWRDWAVDVPDEITSRAVLWSFPVDPSLPVAAQGEDVLIVGAVYAGPTDQAGPLLKPVAEFGTPIADMSAEMPFRVIQAMFDPFFPKGAVSSYWKSAYLDGLTDDAIDFVVAAGASRPSPMTLVHVPLLGGAMARIDAESTAFGDRSAPFMLSVDGNWYDREDNDRQIAWVRDVLRDAAPFTTGGTYLNFDSASEREDPEMLDAAFGPNLARLRRLKRAYDPSNLFTLNNNIRPG